jgi:hypothetical protein
MALVADGQLCAASGRSSDSSGARATLPARYKGADRPLAVIVDPV